MRKSFAILLVLAACTHPSQLAPAPSAQTVMGNPSSAEKTIDGVRVVVESDAWRSGRVRQVISPVKVTIENRGEHRIQVAYGQFTLSKPSSFRLGSGYDLTPWAGRFYRWPAPETWRGQFPYDAAYSSRGYGASPASLPDSDARGQALPEGVLEPGGMVTGFLYFADQPRGTLLTFNASLIDADVGQGVGTVAIPFVVK